MLRMGILFIFLLCLAHGKNAKNIEVDYSVEFGIVGEVARVHASLTSSPRFYSLDANISVVGNIAKTITNNLKERHISKGHVIDGVLMTDMYQMIKSYGKYHSTTIYRVNHKKKRVIKHYKKWENSKKIIDKKVTLAYYGSDDMMTLFLNLSKHIKDKHKSKNYRFSTVGADRKNGRADVSIPSTKVLKQIKKLVGRRGKEEWYTTVVMHRKLYHSKKGELVVRMGKEGLVEKAVLKDLIFFGDVRIIRQ